MTAAAGPEGDPRWIPAVDLLRRTGMREFQIRFCEEDEPVVWIAVARHDVIGGKPVAKGGSPVWSAGAGMNPTAALFALCDSLIDGGICRYCQRPAGFAPDPEMGLLPGVCWQRWNPGRKEFSRSCGNLDAGGGELGFIACLPGGGISPRAVPTPSGARPGPPARLTRFPRRRRMDDDPFTLAMRAGRCPLCMGSGQIGELAICFHDPPLCEPGSPCHLCLGTGRWPPPGDISQEDGG